MNRWQEMVREFHHKFGQEVGADPFMRRPGLRTSLVAEEAEEFDAAVGERNLPGAVKELVDLIYVAIGTAVTWGVDLEPVFTAIHAANMTKGGGTRGDGKILKGPNYVPADIGALLRAQGWDGSVVP
jgi:predicted HAD superfamily Cof-like phosphohydrolase